MPSPKSIPPRSALERASWIAGVLSAVFAVLFGIYQSAQPQAGTSVNITGNTAPIIMTQSSPGANIVVNIAPKRIPSDQDNCNDDQRWVGAKPKTAKWSGEISPMNASHAVFVGELHWSPEISGKKATTAGNIEIEIGGQISNIYEWNTPTHSVHAFRIPIGKFIENTSGKFQITWRFRSGTSGVCIEDSRVVG